jgi:endonuclease YncB( thermonuclease family)
MNFQKVIIRLPIICIIFSTCLFVPPSFSSDNTPLPVSDESLQKLNLDRKYHRCISVADGDTLSLEGIGPVRFIGVDTPEKNHPKLPVQYMSQEASNFTRNLCLNKMIRLEYDSYDEDKRGKYGRVLGYLYLEDGTFVQEELLKRGYAIAYTKYPFDKNRKQFFLKLEQKAKKKGIGLWDDNGFSEVKWILKQNHPMIRVSYLSNEKWELRYWKFVLNPIPSNELEANVNQLYTWIFELSSRDLKAKLEESGYKQSIQSNPNEVSFLIFGMAHKKWGILYEGYVYPRILPNEFNEKCEQIVKILTKGEYDNYKQRLLNYGYRSVPADHKYLPKPNHRDSDCPRPKAPESFSPLVCWDQAGDYIGKVVQIQGEIVRSHNSGKAVFLNFHNNFTRYMSAVIFKRDYGKFPPVPEKYYFGKLLRIKGKVKQYKGKPEIILKDREQIEILKIK